ncbi:MAG: hypothetical protein D6706_06585 [Chloroflexi bacterium]|nr:MAG: hypothetical protein D6706_06585 [Chloroflexota bacterium]
MTPKILSEWIRKIQNTQETEPDCDWVKAYLPAFAEANFTGQPFDKEAQVRVHLNQCPDCAELYEGIQFLLQQEADNELESIEIESERETAAPPPHSQSETSPIPAP